MKFAIYIGAAVGGFIGGWLPTFWGASPFDVSSLLWGVVGTVAGLFAGYKIGTYFDV